MIDMGALIVLGNLLMKIEIDLAMNKLVRNTWRKSGLSPKEPISSLGLC